jgi:phage repressor protein C with HTH and peptisase S24 domain
MNFTGTDLAPENPPVNGKNHIALSRKSQYTVCMTQTLADRLTRLMRQAGYNPRSLSLAASLGPTAVRDIVDGRISSPRYATLQALAQILGVGVEQLVDGEAPASGPPPPSTPSSPPPSSRDSVFRDLPVYGSAEGGQADGATGGAMVMSSDPIQFLGRPDPLQTVRAGYGVYIVGESMIPAYEQGDVALVHPSLPPRRNSDVILTRQDPDGVHHALVKRLIGWTDANWHVRQYNPHRDFDLPRAIWTEIRTIVGKYNAR